MVGMTLDLDALAKLCEAATPGPWYAQDDGAIVPHDSEEPWDAIVDAVQGLQVLPQDAAFIAAARTALPALIAERDAALGDLLVARMERDTARAELAETETALVNTRNFCIERTTERDRLKAQLDAAVEALEHAHCPHACMSPCPFARWRDAVLAKIKETP